MVKKDLIKKPKKTEGQFRIVWGVFLGDFKRDGCRERGTKENRSRAEGGE